MAAAAGGTGPEAVGIPAVDVADATSPRSTIAGPPALAGSRCSDPSAVVAGRSRVDLVVPEAEVGEPRGPSLLGSCRGPPASPATCSARSPGRRTCPGPARPIPVLTFFFFFVNAR